MHRKCISDLLEPDIVKYNGFSMIYHKSVIFIATLQYLETRLHHEAITESKEVSSILTFFTYTWNPKAYIPNTINL